MGSSFGCSSFGCSLILHLVVLVLLLITIPSCTTDHPGSALRNAQRIMGNYNFDNSIRSYLDTVFSKEIGR